MKNGKSIFGFSYMYIKYGKFWSVSLEHFIKHKLLFSEEWTQRARISITLGIGNVKSQYIVYVEIINLLGWVQLISFNKRHNLDDEQTTFFLVELSSHNASHLQKKKSILLCYALVECANPIRNLVLAVLTRLPN